MKDDDKIITPDGEMTVRELREKLAADDPASEEAGEKDIPHTLSIERVSVHLLGPESFCSGFINSSKFGMVSGTIILPDGLIDVLRTEILGKFHELVINTLPVDPNAD